MKVHAPRLSGLSAIVRREFICLLRMNRTFFVVSGALGFVLLWVSRMSNRPMSPTLSGDIARELHACFMACICLFGGLVIPLLASLSIAVERQRGTWELLRMTHVRDWEIVAGKALSFLGLFFVVLIAVMPVIGVIFFQVGVGWAQFMSGTALAVQLAILSALIGVACSAYRAAPTSCVVITLLLLLAYHVFSGLMFIASPVVAIGMNLFQFSPISFIASSVWMAVGSLCAFFIARQAVRLNRAPGEPEIKRYVPADVTYEVMHSALPPDTDAGSTVQGSLQFAEEATEWPHARPMSPAKWGVALMCAAVAFILAIGGTIYAGNMEYSPTGRGMQTWMLAVTALLTVLAPAVVARRMVSRHENGTLDMLRMTLIRPHELVLQDLRHGAIWLAATLPGFIWSVVIILLVAAQSPEDFFWHLLMHTAPLPLIACSLTAAQCASLLTRNSFLAIVFAYVGGPGAVWLLYSLGGRLGGWFAGPPALRLQFGPRGGLDLMAYSVSMLLASGVAAGFVLLSCQLVARRHMRDR